MEIEDGLFAQLSWFSYFKELGHIMADRLIFESKKMFKTVIMLQVLNC